MPVAPTVPTFYGAEIVTSTKLNLTRDAINFMRNPIEFFGRQTVAGSYANATWTSITMDTEDYDTGNGHSLVTNTSRYVAPYDGLYLCSATATFALNATGLRGVAFLVNGSNRTRKQQGPTNALDVHVMSTEGKIFLNTGDYIEAQGYQSSGGALASVVVTDQSVLQCTWMGTGS